uniref:Uncharacterized protein n=1 Tax=Tanacetum cinerariifolium TaxID=118510 RepID=A0A6L2NC78_TANCI|nr:hypothetical protein [Tanacetum cinerariifolium]
MHSFWTTRSADSMLKSLEIFWISVQELKVKNTELQNDDDTVTLLIDLSYKGLLHKYTSMYVNHMSHPWRTLAAIINKCLSGKIASSDKLRKSRIDIMWGMFYRENSKSYQMFLKYSTSQIPLKKSRGKGSQGKKTVYDSQENVDISEESEPEPEHDKKKTASRIMVKKKVIIFADDNIILDLDVALELGKSISLTKAEEEEAAKQVHATHARIMTEYVPESAKKKNGSRSSRSVVIQDTLSAPKPKPATTKPKLKGVQSLTLAEKEAVDIMQALNESKKTNKRQPGTRGSSERSGKVITEEKAILEWGSKQESEYSEEDQLNDEEKDYKEGDADDEGDDHISDTQDTDDEDAKTEYDEDEIYKYKIHVLKDEDVEMTNANDKDSKKGDAEISDVAQADVEKTKEIKDVAKKVELPPTSSSLFVSSSFYYKRKHDDNDDDKDPLGGPNQGKKTKRRTTKESKSSKKPSSTQETPKALVQPMVYATKDPLTFNDLMATLIDFSKYVLSRLNIDNLTQDLLLRPAYDLLKGTCTSIIKLEYNFQECFNALTDKFNWNNPKGDCYPFNLSKPLPLKDRSGHLTVIADYFFNNDLEYPKSFDLKRMYTMSITKTKSNSKILDVKSVSVKKLHGYGHLEEVVVKRDD